MKDKPGGSPSSPDQSGERSGSEPAADHAAIALKIEEQAAREDIPLDQDPVLTGLLSAVPPQGEIPENLYIALAEIVSCLKDAEESIE